MTVLELLEALTPYLVPADGTHVERVVTVETQHRRYLINRVRANEDGDPVIEVVFHD